MGKIKLINFCDRATLFSLYAAVYFLPISKALIEIFVYLAIFCFLFKRILSAKILPRTPFNSAIFVYLVICFLSIFVSSNLQTSIRAFLGKVLTNVTLFFVIADTMNTERRVRKFVYILIASSLLLGIDGIYQYFTHKDFIRNRPYYDLPRIRTTFPTPNDFGCYLVSVIPFALVNFFIKLRYKAFRFFYLVLFLLLFTCLLLTVSRGAWFAFISTILFMSMWIRSIGILFLAIGIFILATQQFYYPILKGRLDNLFIFIDHSSKDRMIMWTTAWKMFISKPLIGLGLGTFMFNFKKFVSGPYSYGVPYAHNCYLQMASEIGILGLVSFLTILVAFFSYGIILLNTRAKTFYWYTLLACLAAVLGFCVQMTVDTSFYNLDLGILFWLILGLGVAAIQGVKLEQKNPT